jgi:N-acyl-L-homoserine lactone synthetase
MKFNAYLVTDEKELKEIYRLRYKVYVEEWGFERAEDHPDGLEIDEFDKSSVHFAARDDKGNLIGTVRLIINPPGGFPIERYCEINIDKDKIPRESVAEVSRLAISKSYRRRAEDRYIFGPDEERREIGSFYSFGEKIQYRRIEDRYRREFMNLIKKPPLRDRRVRPEAVICLYKVLYHESKRRKLTHWYAIMTKGLFILLRKLGINFQLIGDPVDYHGIRSPYLGDIQKIEKEVSINNPELFKEFTQDL